MRTLITKILSIATLAILFTGLTLHAQFSPVFSMAKKVGGIGAENVYASCTDASGNIYITGVFTGTADFDPSAATANLVAAGGNDIYLAKYTSAGVYQWAIGIGAASADVPYGLTLDASGNPYITGYFTGTVDFDPSAGTSNLMSASAGSSDVFFAKYTSAGALSFAKGFGGTSSDVGRSIVLDASNNIYVCGYFAGTCDFDPSAATVNKTSAGGNDEFICKYDATGAYVAAKKIGSTSNDQALGMTIDASSNIYVTGIYTGTVDFDPSAAVANLISAGGEDAFFAEYSSSLLYTFAKSVGGSSNDYAKNIMLDASGNIYLSGYFRTTTDFDPSGATANLTVAGSTDIFLAKYSSAGAYIWADALGGTGTDVGEQMAVDNNSNILFTGYFNGTADFDPSASTLNLTSAGGNEIYLADYSPAGALVFAKRIGSTGADNGVGICSTPSGNALLTGTFSATVDFDPGTPVVSRMSSGSTDVFFASYVICNTVTASISSSTNVTCNGAGNGSATASGSGGSGFTYSWAPSGGTAATASNLAPATYTCTVTNSCGNSATATVTITQPTAITSSISSQSNVSCNGGNDGAVTVSAAGGTGSFTYSWAPSGGTAATGSSLTSGTYTCTITDANGCTHTQTATITQPSAITSSISSSSNVTCGGGSDASATVSAAGGAGSFTYSWSPSGGTAATANGLSAGTYTCTITDANGCTHNQTVTLTQPTPVSGSVTSQSNVSCNGSNDGSATIAGSGGTPAYSYSWSPSGGNAATASNLSPATYTVTITDASGCTGTTTVTITQPAVLVTAPSSTDITCFGSNNGTASANVSGGTSPYSYVWTPSGGTGATASGLSTGTYTCNITDNNGCTTSATFSITEPTALTVNATGGTTICNGNATSLGASSSGGTGSVSFNWMPGNLNGASVSVSPNTTTTYTCTGTDANGCTNTGTVTVTVQNCLTATLPCGMTYTAKTQSVSSNIVMGAIQYKFSFYDNATLALVTSYTQASRTLVLTSVPNLYYGRTYRWTVAVNTGAGFGAESSINCTMTLAQPTTLLACNAHYSNFSSYTTVVNPGGVANFIFTVYDQSTGLPVSTVTQTSNYLYFTSFTGLHYGNTYNWTVKCKYLSTASTYTVGPESTPCPVTFDPPVTTVPCNGTYNRSTGYSAATVVNGAGAYRFSFYQGATLIGQLQQSSNYVYFSNVPNIHNQQSYTWGVEVYYNTGSGYAYGPSSTLCPISFSSSAISVDPSTETFDRTVADPSVDQQEEITLNVYPNPASDVLHLEMNAFIQNVYIYSMEGELVRSFSGEQQINLDGLAAGNYCIYVNSDKGQFRKIFIKE